MVPAKPYAIEAQERPRNYAGTAWKLMRYSGVLIIPLAFVHILIQDVIVGVHNINLNYVQARWQLVGWRIYDAFLLVFAFSHGMNGFRQVLMDFINPAAWRRWVSIIILVIWLSVSIVGAVAIIGGVRP
jgi:succinate dehydrogenase / fumarate reductase membrane anchor subunit